MKTYLLKGLVYESSGWRKSTSVKPTFTLYDVANSPNSTVNLQHLPPPVTDGNFVQIQHENNSRCPTEFHDSSLDRKHDINFRQSSLNFVSLSLSLKQGFYLVAPTFSSRVAALSFSGRCGTQLGFHPTRLSHCKRGFVSTLMALKHASFAC